MNIAMPILRMDFFYSLFILRRLHHVYAIDRLHEQIVGVHALLLHAGWCNVNVVVVPDADAATGSRHPAQLVELTAQLRNELARMLLLVGAVVRRD